MIPFFLEGPVVSVFLTDGRKPTAMTLHASADGAIEVFAGHKARDHHIEERQFVPPKDAQKFYEGLLVQLGYEVPRVKLREIFKGRLSVRRSEHLVAGRVRTEYTLTCHVGQRYIIPDPERLVPHWIRVSFGPKRALELARVLAEPLGWELEG